MPNFLFLAIIIVFLFLILVIFFVNRGTYPNFKKRGGVVTIGRVVDVQRQNILVGQAITPATKMVVEIEHDGVTQNYNVTTFKDVDFDVNSHITVLVNFSTGECGLYEGN